MELLSYDLQFFAQEGPGGEKTEPATPKRLQDARKKGQVAKSRELTSSFELLALFVVMKIFVKFMGENFINVFKWAYGKKLADFVQEGRSGLTVHAVIGFFIPVILRTLIIMAPFLIAGFMISFLGDLLQVGWKVATEPLKPDMKKISPASGFKRIFSKTTLFELVKSIFKIVLIFLVAYNSLKSKAPQIFILYDMNLNGAVALIGNVILDTAIRISALYLIIGFADFIFQKIKFNNDMKMTKQEIKDEFKDTEGDPQIKQRQKQRMMEVSQRRMMNDVPKADVVITNPTHIAVALKYDEHVSSAPIVLAKGEDYLAEKIKKAARENDIMITENKPLARAIYATVDIGQEIPPELYEAVAEILAMVYNGKKSV